MLSAPHKQYRSERQSGLTRGVALRYTMNDKQKAWRIKGMINPYKKYVFLKDLKGH